MTDEELAAIRERWNGISQQEHISLLMLPSTQVRRDVGALLAEVERLRAIQRDTRLSEERQMQRANHLYNENAAMREIVQAVAKYDATYCGLELGHECAFNAQQRARSGGQYFGCHWNKGEADRTRHMFIHGPACPVTKARALLGMKGE